MFEGASPALFEMAKQLRKNMTDAEIVLWMYLKKGISKLKFRRQHPIGIYIADFYCHKAKLIIEVDGSIHNRADIKEADKTREQDLRNWGYSVIRFSNQQVLLKTDKVISTITTYINNIQSQNASSDNGV